MKVDQIKRIPIEEFLSREGFNPEKANEDILWYRSPLRKESSPSFKVDRKKNLWYDFGTGEGGDVISFAMKFKEFTFVEALRYLDPVAAATIYLSIANCNDTPKLESQKPSDGGIRILCTNPLTGGPLMEYLRSRAITDESIVNTYCMAVTYLCRSKNYFAIGFRNDSGGYELRSKYAKLASAPKDITTVQGVGGRSICHVFEGFMDFLSFRILKRDNTDSCIILNSVFMSEKAIPKLQQYQRVELYLDNDDTGRIVTKRLKDALISVPSVIDRSILYARYKDLNESLCNNHIR